MQAADVVVAGAGPTGLLIAGDLAAMGHCVTVVEKRDRQDSNLTRAFSLHSRAMDQLAIRGLSSRLVDQGNPVGSIPLLGSLEVPFHRLRTPHPFMLVIPQYVLERELQARAEKLGVEFRYGHEVTGLAQGDRSVQASGKTGTGDPFVVESTYLVGADGLRSAVRESIGVDFPGEAVLTSVIIADVLMRDPPGTPLAIEANEYGFGFICPFGDGWYRVLAWSSKTPHYVNDKLDFAELQQLFRNIFGRDLGLHEPRWISRFHSSERQATSYRVGRVFLVGDAAHVHSPAGGLGMNVGVQDAANLGWKLSYALRTGAAEELLDSYDREMRPVGERAIKDSGNLVRAAKRQSTMPGPLRRAVVALADHSGRLGRAYALSLATSLSGIACRYGRSPKGSLVGRFWPGAALSPDVGRYLQEGRFVLTGPRGVDGLGHVLRDRPVVNLSDPDGDRWLLVRPDGYVSWQSEALSEAGLTDALRRFVPA